MTLVEYLEAKRAAVNTALDAALPPRHPDAGRLVEAMRYSLLLPGKRLRAIVCLATAEAFGGRERDAMALGVAVEMVHASSLILDDLPSFDDARLRRGQPASHIKFGEATAVLAAVALLSASFRHLLRQLPHRWLSPDEACGSCLALADSIGEQGMVAGEALDLAARTTNPGLDEMERIHALKTGSLFIACAVDSARLSGAGAQEQAALRAYAKNVGLAFQITDDLIEAKGDSAASGKSSTRDRQAPNFVALAGTDGARQIVSELVSTAITSITPLGKRVERLAEIARMIEIRDR